MADEISFVIPGETVPWARAGGRGGVRFTQAKQRNYMAVVRDFATIAMKGRPLIEGPVQLDVTAIALWPKSFSEKKKAASPWKTSRSDLTNIVKLLEDAINGIVYQDDAQVSRLIAEKRYGDKPMLRVTVTPLAPSAV